MTIPEKKIVFVVGATGSLGGMIAGALLDKPGVTVRCLVRPGSRDKLAPLAARGVEVVEGDLGPGSEASLTQALEGAWSVVSVVQGGPDVIVDGQLRLLRAAAAAGVRRLIPSDFSFDLFGLAEGENINSDWRRQFATSAARERGSVEVVHVLNGVFLDVGVLFGFLGVLNLEKGTAALWGDGNTPMDVTTYADTARYTAEAAVDPDKLPEKFNVAGETLTFHELVRAVAEASNKPLTVERRGSLSDLDATIERLVKADPANVYAYLPLMYYRGMLNGKGKLAALVNGRYPHIRPTTVREYVALQKL